LLADSTITDFGWLPGEVLLKLKGVEPGTPGVFGSGLVVALVYKGALLADIEGNLGVCLGLVDSQLLRVKPVSTKQASVMVFLIVCIVIFQKNC
jgi:hypothetical protein